MPSPGWNNEGATIYSKKVYDYPINKTGRFDYTLPQYHFGDGSYYIEISSPSFGDDHIDTSGAIYIVGDDVAALNAAHGDRQMAGALAGVEGVIDMLSAFLGQ